MGEIEMITISDELVRYRKEGGLEHAFTDGDPGYFQLWPANEIEKWNQEYQTLEYAPGFVGFGSDGGGEMLAFDERGAVFMIPFIGDGPDDAKKIANTWSEIVSRITDE